jgi:hypothetical protein
VGAFWGHARAGVLSDWDAHVSLLLSAGEGGGEARDSGDARASGDATPLQPHA